MRTFRYLMLLLSLSISLQAQDRGTKDIISLSGRYALPTLYDDTYHGTQQELGMLNSLTAGFKLAPKTLFAVNVNHFYFNVQNEAQMPDGIASPIKVNGIILRTGIIQTLNNGGKIQALIAPRLMSDFKNVDGNSFQLGAVLSYSNDLKENLNLGFGAIYNQELFGPYFVPLFLLDWQVSERWYIEGMIPVTAKVHYRVTEKLEVGFSHFGLITTYFMGDEEYAGDYIERQSIDLSLFARERIYKQLYIEVMAGRSFGRSYKQYDGDDKVDFAIPLYAFGDNRTIKNVSSKDGMIFTVKLIFNMQVPE